MVKMGQIAYCIIAGLIVLLSVILFIKSVINLTDRTNTKRKSEDIILEVSNDKELEVFLPSCLKATNIIESRRSNNLKQPEIKFNDLTENNLKADSSISSTSDIEISQTITSDSTFIKDTLSEEETKSIIKNTNNVDIELSEQLNESRIKTTNQKEYAAITTILESQNVDLTYDELLQQPQWKKFREEILTRDKYKCRRCGRTYDLQVHHKYYSKYPNGQKVDPWNYPNDALITLCGACHKKVHSQKKIKVYYRKYDN